MEAEIVALGKCCRELFPVSDLLHEIGNAVGLGPYKKPKMHVKIHEEILGLSSLQT